MPIFLALATFVSTLSGGLFAHYNRGRLHFLLAFAAGVLLGVVAFDLLPEIFELEARGADPRNAMAALVAGFILFHALERFVLVHHGHEHLYAPHRHPRRGMLEASALVGHSFMDGVAIGVGYQVSPSLGVIVAIAVITHDFCDGLNTFSLMLIQGNSTKRAMVMLVLDALAPIAGAASSLAFSPPVQAVSLYLGFFAGFLLYVGAADVLPEAHSSSGAGDAAGLIGLTCAGAAFTFVVSRILAS